MRLPFSNPFRLNLICLLFENQTIRGSNFFFFLERHYWALATLFGIASKAMSLLRHGGTVTLYDPGILSVGFPDWIGQSLLRTQMSSVT